MVSSLSPSSLAVLFPDDDYFEDDNFEFTPLLLRPRRRRRRARTAERPRTDQAAATIAQLQPPQRARRGVAAVAPTPASRKVRWHDMAFGSVRVPAAMDMGDIRRRLNSRQAPAGNEPSSATAGWAPWRLIRSLSCKGIEAVAAAAAPVRLV